MVPGITPARHGIGRWTIERSDHMAHLPLEVTPVVWTENVGSFASPVGGARKIESIGLRELLIGKHSKSLTRM
jgi:hypothetical protein